MEKKGQGLSMNVIIIAAIALLVLVILAVFVLNSGKNIRVGTSCESTQGTCITGTSAADCTAAGYTYKAADCPNEGEICCMTI